MLSDLFDCAFKSADNYGIKVFSDIFPKTEDYGLGGLKSPRSAEHLQAIADCVKHLTQHFSQFPSLYS